MHTSTFDETLDQIVRNDSRYHRDAYLFVREALDHTQRTVAKAGREGAKQEVRHVSGQELLEGIRGYALGQFGPMTVAVLHEWGVRRCEDFGEIVFNMVESEVLARTRTDSRDDFKGGYDFDEAFRKPFQPTKRKSALLPPPEARHKVV